MAHFAKLGKGNIVEKVVVVNNEVITDADGNQQEQLGIDFLKELHNDPSGIYIQTSYNNNIRGRYAAVGGLYDSKNDRFLPRKPHPTWSFNEEKYWYDPPVPKPIEAGKNYYWDDNIYSWVEAQSDHLE